MLPPIDQQTIFSGRVMFPTKTANLQRQICNRFLSLDRLSFSRFSLLRLSPPSICSIITHTRLHLTALPSTSNRQHSTTAKHRHRKIQLRREKSYKFSISLTSSVSRSWNKRIEAGEKRIEEKNQFFSSVYVI
jgi:hypothetical protein